MKKKEGSRSPEEAPVAMIGSFLAPCSAPRGHYSRKRRRRTILKRRLEMRSFNRVFGCR